MYSLVADREYIVGSQMHPMEDVEPLEHVYPCYRAEVTVVSSDLSSLSTARPAAASSCELSRPANASAAGPARAAVSIGSAAPF
eukprot:1191134-Prorocentrum_minimum.AAC.3